MTSSKQIAVALALGLAVPAGAQAPAPVPAPAPQAQQPGGQALTQEQIAALGRVWDIMGHHAGFGDAAATHGSSGEVAQFCKQLGDDNKRFSAQLSRLLQARGVSTSSLPPAPERQKIAAASKDLQARNGADFDRAVVAHIKDMGEMFVDALKAAREATPGRDAELKKFLDTVEDSEEAYLTKARQLAPRVQARTPPGQ